MAKNKLPFDKIIEKMILLCQHRESKTCLLAASIKKVQNIVDLLIRGVDDLTLPLQVAKEFITVSFPEDDVSRFENDFNFKG